MNNKKDALVNDVRFILDECDRLNKVVQHGGLRTLSQHDLLSSLPHPSGVGSVLCGHSAAVKVTELAEEAARRGNLTRRIELTTLRTEISRLIVSRFIKEKRPLNVTQLDRLMSSAVKKAQSQCMTLTHLIPCHLMSARDPERFSIGPVTFHNRASFRRLLLKKAGDRDRMHNDDKAKSTHVRFLLAHAIRYYRNFQWVAEVEIVNCDFDTSKALAEEVVTAALNCLHMLLGTSWTGRMRVGGVNIRSDHRAMLTLSPSGELEPTLSSTGFGEVTFPDGWFAKLLDSNFEYWQTLFAVALESIVCPELERPLSRRFLDAAQWFGEATRDEGPATRTIKFVTALERMLMTEERDDVTSLVAERVAALCFNTEVGSRDVWREKTRAAYDLRSRLVHGSISPRAPEVRRGASVAAEVAEAALLRAIEAFGVEGLQAKSMTSKRTSEWFRRLLQWADATEAGSNAKTEAGT